MNKTQTSKSTDTKEDVTAQTTSLDRRHFLTAGALVASGVASACVLPSETTGKVTAAPAQEPPRPPDAPESGDLSVAAHRVETPGPHGVVTAGHPLAASAGLRMFMQGGAAGDAAVATMAVLNLTEAWASSIAGNGFATVYEKSTGAVKALMFGGAAPLALDPTSDPAAFDWGVKAATTPGAFDGWIELLRRHGRLSLAEVFAPAIELARNGHPIDPRSHALSQSGKSACGSIRPARPYSCRMAKRPRRARSCAMKTWQRLSRRSSLRSRLCWPAAEIATRRSSRHGNTSITAHRGRA